MLEKLTTDDRAYLVALMTSQSYAWAALVQILEDKGLVSRAEFAARLEDVLGIIKQNIKLPGVPDAIRPDILIVTQLLETVRAIGPLPKAEPGTAN